MTTIRGAREFIQTAELTSPVSTFFTRCWSALQERRRRARLRASLCGLADRDLKDIGISRSEIDYFALNGTDACIDPRRH